MTPDFYAELDREFSGFAGHSLISEFSFDSDWDTWEMHPKGDELVYLVRGDVTFELAEPDGVRRERISTPGQFVVVPAGIWHTARPHSPTTMLFVTPGEGTLNDPSPPI